MAVTSGQTLYQSGPHIMQWCTGLLTFFLHRALGAEHAVAWPAGTLPGCWPPTPALSSSLCQAHCERYTTFVYVRLSVPTGISGADLSRSAVRTSRTPGQLHFLVRDCLFLRTVGLGTVFFSRQWGADSTKHLACHGMLGGTAGCAGPLALLPAFVLTGEGPV